MERITKVVLALVICVIVMAHHTGAEESQGKDLINNACKLSPSRDLCIKVLSSNLERSPDADLKDLAIIPLSVAAKNASGMLNNAKMLINDSNLDPSVQQGLAYCKETILDAESQLKDTIASLLSDSESNAQVWLQTLLQEIKIRSFKRYQLLCYDGLVGKS